jgi:drug/metabolite transporter (DMT)-like permease
MTEPLLATFIAWAALGEVLAPVQIVGAVVVLVGVFLAENSR